MTGTTTYQYKLSYIKSHFIKNILYQLKLKKTTGLAMVAIVANYLSTSEATCWLINPAIWLASKQTMNSWAYSFDCNQTTMSKAGCYWMGYFSDSFIVSAEATNASMMKPGRRGTMRRGTRQKNLLTSLPKTPMRKKEAAVRRRMRWPLPWRRSSMTLCELENERTHLQEKDNEKSAQSPQQVVPKNPIFLLWRRRVLRMYEPWVCAVIKMNVMYRNYLLQCK